MLVWWILIILLLIAILVFVSKYSSRSDSVLEEKNAMLDRKNKASASLDLKTIVKNGILGLDTQQEKVVFIVNTEMNFVVKEFYYTDIESFALMLDGEQLFGYPFREASLSLADISARGVVSAFLEKTSTLRGDVGSLDLKIVFRNSSNPYYLFNFYTKRTGAKSVLEFAIHSIEEWADRLTQIIRSKHA